jgi:hypothetical protein
MILLLILAILIAAAFIFAGAGFSNDGPLFGVGSSVVGIMFLIAFVLVSMSLTRGDVTNDGTPTLAECRFQEGVVYKVETSIDHTDFRDLVVVRDEENFDHHACMVSVSDGIPSYGRFVIADGRAVDVEDDGSHHGDTQEEDRERTRSIERSQMMMGPDDEAVEPIVVYGTRP